MNSKALALIDLDHTLLNTSQIKQEFPTLEAAISAFSRFTGQEIDRYLYPDSIAFIAYTKNYFTPAIFTEGPIDFQQAKITHSALGNLIDAPHRFIFDGFTKSDHLSDLAATHHPAILIDDNPKHIAAANALKLITVRITRGDHATEPDITPPTLTVASLQEIITGDLFKTIQPSG